MKISKYLLFLIFIIFPFGQLLRFRLPFLPPTIKFQPLDILTFLFIISVFLENRQKVVLPAIFKYAAPFLGIAVLSFLVNFYKYNWAEIITALCYLLRLIIYFLFLPALAIFLKKQKVPLLKLLSFCGVAVGIFSGLQYFILPDTRFLYQLGWDDHLYRAIGTFLDPSFTALILVLTLALLLENPIFMKHKGLNLLLILFLVTAIVLTFSRLAYILIFLILIYWSIRKKVKIIIWLLPIMLLAIILVPKPTGEGVDLFRKASFLLKVENYQQNIKIIKNNFFFGVGFNFIRPKYRDNSYLGDNNWEISNSGAGSDNSFLFIFATMGVFGFIFFIRWVILTSKYAYCNVRCKGNEILFVSMIIIIVESFFINALFYPWVLLWLMCLIAMITFENEF